MKNSDMMKSMLLTVSVTAVSAVLSAQGLKTSVVWKNICAHEAPLPEVGRLVVHPSDFSRESCWSIGCETMDRDYADFDAFKDFVPETGAGYARLQSGWAKTEQKKGKYDFRWLDAHVDGLIERQVHPWICLCYGNPLYSEHGYDLNAKLFADGPIMDAWLEYVRRTVARYKGRVTMWEVWNEPDGRNNLDSWPLYANLFTRTAKVIREVDPQAKIAAFGSCSPDREYIRQALAEIARMDGIKYIDYITYHAYWKIPEAIVPAVRQLRKDVDLYSPSIGLLMGETGCPGQLEYGHALRHIEWTECSQAKWDLRQMLTHWGLGIPYSVFTMVDLRYTWMLQSFGLLRMRLDDKPVYKRPKFYAVQNVTSVFTDGISPCDGVTAEIKGRDDLTCIGVSKGGKPVGCLLWFSGAMPSSGLERTAADVEVRGLDGLDLVYVDMLTGSVRSLEDVLQEGSGGSAVFNGLPLWDCPMLIVDSKAVDYK